MNKRALLSGLIVGCVLTAAHGGAWACHCGVTPTPAEEFEQVDAVFKGFVVSITPVPGQPYLDAYVLVTGVWKGLIPTFCHVFTPDTEAGCRFPFESSTDYLIYAFKSTESCCAGVFTGSCNRTNRLSNAQEDLEYLGEPSPPVPVEETSWGAVKAMYKY